MHVAAIVFLSLVVTDDMQVWGPFPWERCGPREVQTKLAQRVEKALSQECLFAEPNQIDRSLVLVAPTNRDGSPPNVQHVHYGILKSFMTKRLDNTKPAMGICIKYTSEHGKGPSHGSPQEILQGQQAPPRHQ